MDNSTGTAAELPYRVFYIVCPACGEENSYEKPKEGAFLLSAIEADGHPTGIEATHPYLANRDPLEFFWATCETCYFTVELDDRQFRTWKKETPDYPEIFLKGMLRRHAGQAQADQGLASALGRVIAEVNKPFETLLNKFLLGVYCETLKKKVSFYNMGRYYLRIGWIYRDRDRYVSRTGSRSDPLVHRQSLEDVRESLWGVSIPETDRFPVPLPIPLNETEALKSALRLFEASYSFSKSLTIEAETTLVSLITEVGYRLCCLDGPTEWLPLCTKYLSDLMGNAMKQSADRTTDELSRDKAKKCLDRASRQSEKFRELQREAADGREALLRRMRRGK